MLHFDQKKFKAAATTISHTDDDFDNDGDGGVSLKLQEQESEKVSLDVSSFCSSSQSVSTRFGAKAINISC